MTKRLNNLIKIIMVGLTVIFLFGCGMLNDFMLTEEQKNTIIEQCIEDNELDYTRYLESKWFASTEIFDIKKKDGRMYIYAFLSEGMYASYKGRGYLLSGSDIPVKLTVETETMTLIGEEIPEDGEAYDDSLKELFTGKAYRKCMRFDSTKLNKEVEEKAKAEWDVEIDDDYQLSIDENGNYEIMVIDNDGSDGTPFECHVEEEGTFDSSDESAGDE